MVKVAFLSITERSSSHVNVKAVTPTHAPYNTSHLQIPKYYLNIKSNNELYSFLLC